MYNRFIKSPSTIILTVMPSDVDFTTSEAVLLSQKADPIKERTLGVITKIDKAEKGIKDKIDENELEYKLGFVVLRNRT